MPHWSFRGPKLIGEIWSSCTWMSMSLPRFGKFSAPISLISFLSSLLLLLELPECKYGLTWWYPLSLRSFLHSFLFFILFWFHLICPRVHWYCLLPDQFCSWNFPLLFFFFSSVIVFFSVTLSVWFFLIFCLCWTLHSVLVLFSWFC